MRVRIVLSAITLQATDSHEISSSSLFRSVRELGRTGRWPRSFSSINFNRNNCLQTLNRSAQLQSWTCVNGPRDCDPDTREGEHGNMLRERTCTLATTWANASLQQSSDREDAHLVFIIGAYVADSSNARILNLTLRYP